MALRNHADERVGAGGVVLGQRARGIDHLEYLALGTERHAGREHPADERVNAVGVVLGQNAIGIDHLDDLALGAERHHSREPRPRP